MPESVITIVEQPSVMANGTLQKMILAQMRRFLMAVIVLSAMQNAPTWHLKS